MIDLLMDRLRLVSVVTRTSKKCQDVCIMTIHLINRITIISTKFSVASKMSVSINQCIEYRKNKCNIVLSLF